MSDPVQPSGSSRPIPMSEPAMSGLQLCPVCHGKMRQTAAICPHCGAEKHFGATTGEVLRYTLGGLAAGILFTVTVRAGWIVGLVATVSCVLLAFIMVQSRHGHRWIRPR